MNARRLARSALVVGLLIVPIACAPLQTPRNTDGESCFDEGWCTAHGDDLTRLLRLAERVRTMSEPGQRREHALAQRAFTREANGYNRLRLALLLTLPDTPFQCDACARDLLRDYPTTSGADTDTARFAAWLRDSTERRLQLQLALETERKQRQLVSQQLEKLKAIEQRLNDRDRAALKEPEKTP